MGDNIELFKKADKELFEKTDLLINKFRQFENEPGILRIINNIHSNRNDIHQDLLERTEDYSTLKAKCEYKINCYVDIFNNKFQNRYFTSNMFNVDNYSLKQKYEYTTNKLKTIERNIKELINSKGAKYYKLLGLARNDLGDIASDLQALESHFRSIESKLNNKSNDDFIEFIGNPNLINDWFDFVEKCNNYIKKHDEILYKVRISSGQNKNSSKNKVVSEELLVDANEMKYDYTNGKVNVEGINSNTTNWTSNNENSNDEDLLESSLGDLPNGNRTEKKTNKKKSKPTQPENSEDGYERNA